LIHQTFSIPIQISQYKYLKKMNLITRRLLKFMKSTWKNVHHLTI